MKPLSRITVLVAAVAVAFVAGCGGRAATPARPANVLQSPQSIHRHADGLWMATLNPQQVAEGVAPARIEMMLQVGPLEDAGDGTQVAEVGGFIGQEPISEGRLIVGDQLARLSFTTEEMWFEGPMGPQEIAGPVEWEAEMQRDGELRGRARAQGRSSPWTAQRQAGGR